ncbi:DNA-directed DNA polymerase [Fragilaria crotonensis]|nr:DNA-directed DNA polymerase [Fragilaria crotonensis]KAI2504733.1 DNA-directed DNA polymerase [Fragilaria crotonensis]
MKRIQSSVPPVLLILFAFLTPGNAFVAQTLSFRRSAFSTVRFTSTNGHVWSREQLVDYASKEGVVLSLSTLGPGYRALARAKHNETQILGYCEGFLRPGGSVLHLDKMEVFKKMIKTASIENPGEFRGGGTLLGVGQLLGYLCLLHGKENGCKTGEFLAIDDEAKQHRKLVQYYKRSGFKIIKYVGDGFSDIPDRLVWGGRGTLMREEIDILLESWTRVLAKKVR